MYSKMTCASARALAICSFIAFCILVYKITVVKSQITNSLLVPVGSETFAHCSCGRIRDIESAKLGEFPWTAALVDKEDFSNEPLCWGTVINSRYILSAAHCTYKYQAAKVEVFVGAPDLSQNPRRIVSTIKNHPNFNIGNYTYDNDISLIKLREPLDLEVGDINPICLPHSPPSSLPPSNSTSNSSQSYNHKYECDLESQAEMKTATMNKWKGFRTEGSRRSYQFKQADFFVQSTNHCTILYPKRIRAQYLCGEAHHGLPWNWTWSNCHGDPGAPLLQVRKMKLPCEGDFENRYDNKMKIKFSQMGISAQQKSCKGFSAAKPTLLFIRISRYLKWIMENASDGTFCINSKS